MKTTIVSTLLVASLSLFAQQPPKSLDGIYMTQVEQGVYDFTITDDFASHSLAVSLSDECDSFTEIPKDVLGKDGLVGYFFHFEDYDVLYVLVRGGTLKGSLIEKKKGA
jgi:hypothetical protein